MSAEHWRAALASLPITLRYYETIGSTNDEALQWAAAGAAEYSLVIADRQTAGRGRLQRRWITTPGSALAFSLVVRPTAAEMPHLALFSPLAALALCAALSGYPNLQAHGCCQIKWPNDVLIDGRKVAGVLVEAAWLGADLQALVIGMGVNVGRSAVPPAPDLLFPATSVEENTGVPVERTTLLRQALIQLLALRADLTEPAFIEKYEQLLAFKGQQVSLSQEGRPPLTGVVTGVSPRGDLLLNTAGDDLVTIAAGDVHLRPA